MEKQKCDECGSWEKWGGDYPVPSGEVFWVCDGCVAESLMEALALPKTF